MENLLKLVSIVGMLKSDLRGIETCNLSNWRSWKVPVKIRP